MKLTPRLKHAIDLASRLHHGQMRKDQQTPYISHPYGVALILSHYTDDEDIIIAGLLHDVLEDVSPDKYDAKQMEQDFGARVLSIVQGVTEDITITDYRSRKQVYLDQLASDSTESLMVSTADLTHNIRSLEYDIRKHSPKVLDQYGGNAKLRQWFWDKRSAILKERLDNPIIGELKQALEDFEALKAKP